jgi:hypothetical protein
MPFDRQGRGRYVRVEQMTRKTIVNFRDLTLQMTLRTLHAPLLAPASANFRAFFVSR